MPAVTSLQLRLGHPRFAWPGRKVKIILRGDSGFCRNELMSGCESHGVGLSSALRAISDCGRSSGPRCMQRPSSGTRPANQRGCLPNLTIRPERQGGCDRKRRVVAKAEHIDGRESPRFKEQVSTETMRANQNEGQKKGRVPKATA
jgi:hypothetical protein